MQVLFTDAVGSDPIALPPYDGAVGDFFAMPVAVATISCDISQAELGPDVEPGRNVIVRTNAIGCFKRPPEVYRAGRIDGSCNFARMPVAMRTSV